MKLSRSIFLAIWTVNQVFFLQAVHAQKPDKDGSRAEQPKHRPATVHQHNKPQQSNDRHMNERMQGRTPSHMSSPSSAGVVAVGGYFQSHQIEAARSYYSKPENMGFCPPGLAKKGTGCLPPGQAKAWRKGAPLPASVIYYDLPRSVVLALGAPPPGHKYVRVASDILLIAIGTGMVMDAIEDLVR